MSQKPKKTPEEISAIRREAGRKGGQKTLERYGNEHFSKIKKEGWEHIHQMPKDTHQDNGDENTDE